MKNTERSYNIGLTSSVVPYKGGTGFDGKPIVWDGSFRYPSRQSAFIGEVFSFYEDHTPETLKTRVESLAAEHKVSVDEIIVVLR